MTNSLAAVFDGLPGTLRLERFATPVPTGAEVLVRVTGCTLCGSDLHSMEGRRIVPVPTVLGHEIVGEIVAVGDSAPGTDLAGNPLRVGDRVTWAIVAACGECFLCKRGLPQKCLHAVKYGHEAFRPGRELLGGLAEHCLLVPGTAILRLPDSLPLSVACPTSCATATIAASIEASGPVRDRCIVIAGAGLLGLTACAMARHAGAAEVVCVEVHEVRRALAKRFGATQAIAPEDLGSAVRLATGGYGADAVIELSGSASATQAALSTLRPGGTLVLVGAVFPSPALDVPADQWVRRNLTLRGVHNYAPRHLVEATAFLEACHRGFPFAELVTQWYPLSDVVQAFRAARDPARIRIGVHP